jgi:DNA-binding transcriptional MocR family regulator
MTQNSLPPPYPSISEPQRKAPSNPSQNHPPTEREIEKWKGLKPIQKAILRRIIRRKGSNGYRVVSKKDLAEELNVSKPTIDRQIDILVKDNLLVRKSDGKIEYGPARKNAYAVRRQIYKEETYTDENHRKKVRVIQPGLDSKKPIYLGKRNGKSRYLNLPDQEHPEPYITDSPTK